MTLSAQDPSTDGSGALGGKCVEVRSFGHGCSGVRSSVPLDGEDVVSALSGVLDEAFRLARVRVGAEIAVTTRIARLCATLRESADPAAPLGDVIAAAAEAVGMEGGIVHLSEAGGIRVVASRDVPRSISDAFESFGLAGSPLLAVRGQVVVEHADEPSVADPDLRRRLPEEARDHVRMVTLDALGMALPPVIQGAGAAASRVADAVSPQVARAQADTLALATGRIPMLWPACCSDEPCRERNADRQTLACPSSAQRSRRLTPACPRRRPRPPRLPSRANSASAALWGRRGWKSLILRGLPCDT